MQPLNPSYFVPHITTYPVPTVILPPLPNYYSLTPEQTQKLYKKLKANFYKEPNPAFLEKHPELKDTCKPLKLSAHKILKNLTNELRAKGIQYHAPVLTGGTVSNLYCGLYAADIDINIQIFQPCFDVILSCMIQCIRNLLPSDVQSFTDHAILEAYLPKRWVSPEKHSAFYGFGNVEIKIIYNAQKRWFVSTADQLYIYLTNLSSPSFRSTGDLQTSIDALIYRQFDVPEPEKVDDLLLRATLKKTQGFVMSSELEDIGLKQLINKHQEKNYVTFKEHYNKYLKSHYPDNPTGKMLNLLNFLTSTRINPDTQNAITE